MNIIYYLLPLALLLGGGFALSFIVAAVKGQYDDLDTPARRMLLDDEKVNKKFEFQRTESKDQNGQRIVR